MSKYFWLNNPSTGTEGYCVNSYGALNSLLSFHTKERQSYENVWLRYNEIKKILRLKTKQERYNLCDKLFKQKFPQQEKDKKELPKNQQSKLEKLFS